MTTDTRRFDTIERVVRDERRRVDDLQSTVMARLATHTHPAEGDAVTSVNGETGAVVLDAADVGAAAEAHTHDAADVESGTLDIARIPTGTTSTTVSLGNHTHTVYALYGNSQAVIAHSDTASTTTSGTYVAGTTLGIAFTAPSTGAVLVHHSASLGTPSGSDISASFEIRTGTTVGSGTLFYGPNDSDMVYCGGNMALDAGRTTLVTGLTAGNSYNARIMVRRITGAGTVSYARRKIVVVPAPRS
jgi:hypothetical protein